MPGVLLHGVKFERPEGWIYVTRGKFEASRPELIKEPLRVKKFALVVKNDNGDVVFNQVFTDTHFSKTVVIENTESDIQPTFIIRTGNVELSRQFQVSTTLTSTITVKQL